MNREDTVSGFSKAALGLGQYRKNKDPIDISVDRAFYNSSDLLYISTPRFLNRRAENSASEGNNCSILNHPSTSQPPKIGAILCIMSHAVPLRPVKSLKPFGSSYTFVVPLAHRPQLLCSPQHIFTIFIHRHTKNLTLSTNMYILLNYFLFSLQLDATSTAFETLCVKWLG